MGTNSSPSRPTLSVAMIVRDAEDLLGETLDSIRGIADEIVIADTGSTDATVEIARQGADVVAQVEWQESFALARNECLCGVTGQWVLWLDAGETLDDTAAQQLQNFIDQFADQNKAYMLFVERPATAINNCWEQIGQIRLAPNRAGLAFTGRVRETILPSALANGMGIDMLDCVIRRAGCDGDITKRKARARRNLNLVNLAAHDGTEQLSVLLARAEALGQLGRWDESSDAYRRVLAAAEGGSSEMLEAYYGLLTSMDAEPAAADIQLNTCLEALSIYPLDAQLLCGMGSYLLRGQRLELAERSYAMAVAHGKVDPRIWHLADLADVAVVCLSLVKQLLGDAKRAEQVIREALAERPDSLRLRRQMIETCIKAGREREALEHCRMLPTDAPFRDELPAVIRGAMLAAARKSGEAVAILQAAYDAGCRDVLCLRWLAVVYLAERRLVELKVIIDEWERLEPGNLENTAFRQAIADRPVVGKEDPKSGALGKQGLTAEAGAARPQQRRVDGRSPSPVPLESAPFTPRATSPKL